MKIDAKSSDIFTLLNDALQFASPAIGVPAIEAVRIETSTNDAETINVLGVATDRFVLGVSRITAAGDAGLGFTIATDDVKNVLRIAKTAKRDAGWRRVTIEHNETTVSFTFSSGENITVRTVEADFPRWRQLLVVDVDAIARPAAGLGVDPLKIAQFARIAAAKTSPMQLFPGVDDAGRLKAVHVRIGDDFYGLVMPVRAPGGQLFTHETPGWLS
jgi:hypothetical protein